MNKRRSSFCGFSRGSCGALEENIVPVSTVKGLKDFQILNKLEDEKNDTRDSTMKEKSQSGAKERVSCSPSRTSSFGRCLSLWTSEFSKCGPNDGSSTGSKGKEKSGSTAERVKASTNPSSFEKAVCRKLDFQLNKAMASKLVFGKQNSRNRPSADSNNERIKAPETPSIQEGSLLDQHEPNRNSTVSKGANPNCPGQVVPELPIDGDLSGAERYRRKSPQHLKTKKAKTSEGPGRKVSRSLFLSAGSASDGKMTAVNVRRSALEKTCKPVNSVDQMAPAFDCSPLKSEDGQQKDCQETGESRVLIKKQKAASCLPALPSKEGLNKRVSEFPGFRKRWDDRLFNFGLGFGVVFMITSSKKEIEKLRELQEQTERLVKDLKQEVSRGNFSNGSSQMLQSSEDLPSKYRYENREIEDPKNKMVFGSQNLSGGPESGISGNECNSSAHSIITTESTPQHSGMAQLEAELEAELERMELDLSTEGSCERGIFSGSEMPDNIVYNDLNAGRITGKKSSHDQEDIDRTNYSLSPIELERRLHEVLQKRQEDHIAELEADLKITEDELLDKEKELSWWKEHVLQLLKEHNEGTTAPGDESIASMSTGKGSKKNLFFSYSCNGDDLIKDQESLKRSEASNCCEDIASVSSRGTLDVRDESSNSDSLLADFKHLNNLQTGREHANSLVQTETWIRTFGSNSPQNSRGTERKQNVLLDITKKAVYTDNLQNDSTAREPCIDMPSASKSIAFQQTKEFIANSVFNTPLGYKKMQNTPEYETYSVGRREPRSPVLNKIKHWEALSRRDTSSTQSCDIDNDHLLATCHHSLVSC